MQASIEVDIEDINESNLKDIPEPCRGCVYWEFPESLEKDEKDPNKKWEFESKKREWFGQTMKQFGTCGKIVYHNGEPVAYAQYAPAGRLPNINDYEAKAVGKSEEGVVFLSCLFIANETMRDKGVGKALLQNIVEDLRRRGFKAIETFARRSEADNPSGPMKFYVENGFHVKDNTNPEYPLMSLYL